MGVLTWDAVADIAGAVAHLASAASFAVALYLAVRVVRGERPYLWIYTVTFNTTAVHEQTVTLSGEIVVVNRSRTSNAVGGYRLETHPWIRPEIVFHSDFPSPEVPVTIAGLGVAKVPFKAWFSLQDLPLDKVFPRGQWEAPTHLLDVMVTDVHGNKYIWPARYTPPPAIVRWLHRMEERYWVIWRWLQQRPWRLRRWLQQFGRTRAHH